MAMGEFIISYCSTTTTVHKHSSSFQKQHTYVIPLLLHVKTWVRNCIFAAVQLKIIICMLDSVDFVLIFFLCASICAVTCGWILTAETTEVPGV